MKTQLISAIRSLQAVDLESRLHHHACVSIILRGNSIEDLEVGFIQRAFNPEDRWSGHIAFPGGRREEYDSSALAAALRETQEEVGVDLITDEMIGQLSDVQARKAGTQLDFFIRPFVFFTQREFAITLDAAEVADFFWVPLKELKNPNRITKFSVNHDNGTFTLPALDLDRDPPLWGLTYMMILDLLERFETIERKHQIDK